MAGHSKWANIQHRKVKQDQLKSRLFSRAAREITVAVRQGNSGDAKSNARLRLAIEKAHAVNMTKEKIDVAIKKGLGKQEGAVIEEIRYEAFGPFGVAFIIDAMTDNRNRTVALVRQMLSKAGGTLGGDGSVTHLFKRQGVIQLAQTDLIEERLMELVLEAGGEDLFIESGEPITILATIEKLESLQNSLENAQVKIESMTISWIPLNMVTLEGDARETTIKLWESLDAIDDVQSVYCNAEISLIDDIAS